MDNSTLSTRIHSMVKYFTLYIYIYIYIYIQHLQNQYYVIRIVRFNSVNSETHDVDQRVYSLIYYAEEKVCVLCVTYTSLFCLN